MDWKVRLFTHGILAGLLAKAAVAAWQALQSDKATFGLLVGLTSLYAILAYRKAKQALDAAAVHRQRMREDTKKIEAFLKYDLRAPTKEELEKLTAPIERGQLHGKAHKKHWPAIRQKLQEARQAIQELEWKQRINALQNEKQNLEKDIKNLAQQKKLEQYDEEEQTRKTKEELDTHNNKVFLVSELSEEQIGILKEEGYTQVNEYDILNQELQTVLVKKILNHTTTHTFLTWSIVKLLEKMGFEEIQEHETRDADVTFKHDNKTYALEIETGNLLRKQKQLQEKVAYLSKKYKSRWLFVVSNKNLAAKYKQYGPTTHRKGVAKNITKMTEKQHPEKTGGQRK